MVLTYWDEDVFVDIERCGQALSKNVHDVIITIRAVVEFDANRVLPFLRFEDMIRVRSVKNKALKIEFAHTTQFRPRLEVHVGIIADAFVAFEKSDFGIEVGADFAMLSKTFEPAGELCQYPFANSLF
jgi:hypothetical protein